MNGRVCYYVHLNSYELKCARARMLTCEQTAMQHTCCTNGCVYKHEAYHKFISPIYFHVAFLGHTYKSVSTSEMRLNKCRCMCSCAYVHMRVCVHVCTHITLTQAYTHTYAQLHMDIHVSVHQQVCEYIYMSVRLYVYTFM